MNLVLGASGIHNEDDIKGNPRPLPGRYHVFIKDATQKEINGSDKIIIEFEVLAGTTPGQEGRDITEFFATTEKAIPRLQRLAIIVGLLKPGEPAKPIDFADGIDKQLVIEIEQNKYTNKDGKEIEGVRVGYLGFWSLGNPAVNDVPRDNESIRGGPKKQKLEDNSSGSNGAGDGDAASDPWADV